MTTEYMYLVIGRSPRYHAEDEKYTKIYGLFSDENEACHCYHYQEKYGYGGAVSLIKLPINVHFNSFYISSSEEDNVPEPIGTCESHKEFYTITINKTLFGVYSDYTRARKLKKRLNKRIDSDKEFASKFAEERLYGFVKTKKKYISQEYPEIRKYLLMNLEEFDFDKSIIDTEFDPIDLTRQPFLSRRIDDDI